MSEKHIKRQLHGAVTVFFGVLLYATDTLLIALAGTSGFVAGFWRGGCAFVILLLSFLFVYRDNAIRMVKTNWRPMLLSGFLYGIGGVLYANSVTIAGTSVSLVMLSLTPILTSLFSTLFLKEPPRKSTVAVMCVCFTSVVFMFYEGLRSGSIFGYFFALTVPIAIALNFINLRKHSDVSRIGVSMIGGLVAAAVGFCATSGHVRLPLQQLRYLVVLGCIVIPIGQVLITTGTKYISASETSLINSLECVFGLLYVWIFIGTKPSTNTIIGGAIVFCSISFDMIGVIIKTKRCIHVEKIMPLE